MYILLFQVSAYAHQKITVHEAVKGEDGSREQEVEIYYRFIGKID